MSIVVDPGFPTEDHQTKGEGGGFYLSFGQIFPKTACKRRKLDRPKFYYVDPSLINKWRHLNQLSLNITDRRMMILMSILTSFQQVTKTKRYSHTAVVIYCQKTILQQVFITFLNCTGGAIHFVE